MRQHIIRVTENELGTIISCVRRKLKNIEGHAEEIETKYPGVGAGDVVRNREKSLQDFHDYLTEVRDNG